MVRALSFADTISLPSFPDVTIPSPLDAARSGYRAASRAARSPAGRRALQLARTGSRLAGRYIPLLIAIELGEFLAPDLTIPMGKLAMDLRGAWTRLSTCGISPETLRWTQTYPSCGPDFVIGGGTGLPQTGSIKSFTLWGAFYPLRYHISGGLLAQGSEKWQATAFPAPAISGRFNAAMAFPVADTLFDDRPLVLALSAAARPQQRFGHPPLPVPFGVWPGVRPNSNVPSSVQIQTEGYDRDTTKPVETVTKPTVAIPTGIETLPLPVQDVLSKPVPTSGPVTVTLASQGQSTTADPHKMKPPGRGEKESKFKMKPGPRNLVLRTFNNVSEYKDLIDALYWAIDTDPGYSGNIRYGVKQYDWRRPPGRKVWWKDSDGKWQSRWVHDVSLQEKSDFIYQHFKDLDLAKAAANILKNEIGDTAYGAIGRRLGKAAQATHKSGVAQPARAPTLSRASGNNDTGKLPLKPLYDAIDRAFGVDKPGRLKATGRNIGAHPQQFVPNLGPQYFQ